jgi:cytoskeletal protein CcmA (bactofilin family)
MEPRSRNRGLAHASVVAVALVLAATQLAGAVTTTWTGASPDDYRWSNDANWDVGAPEDFDAVRFSAVGGLSIQDIPGLLLDEVDMTGFTGVMVLQAPLQVMSEFLVAGTLNMEGGDLAVAGRLRVDGDLLAAAATIAVGGDLVVQGSLSGDGAAIDVGESVDAGGGGSVDMGSGTLGVHRDARFQGAADVSFAANGELYLAGGGASVLTFGPGSVALGDVRIERDSAGDVITLERPGGPPVAMGGMLHILRGILDVQSGLDVAGGVAVDPPSELRNAAAPGVTWTFGASVVVTSGALRCTAPACTLSFAPESAGSVDVSGTGTLEIRGSASLGRVRLQQDGTVGGSRWILDHAPTATILVEGAEVQDSEAQPGPIQPIDSIDLGNNLGWSFGPKTCRWTDAAPGNSVWSDDANWSPSRPAIGDDVVFDPIGGLSIQDLPGLGLADLDMRSYSGVLVLEAPLDVAGEVVVEGTLDVAGESLIVGGGVHVDGVVSSGAGSVGLFGGPVRVGVTGEFVAPHTATFLGDVVVEAGGELRATTPGSVLGFQGDEVVEAGGLFRLASAAADVRFAAGRTLTADSGSVLEIEGGAGGEAMVLGAGRGGARWLVDLRPGSSVAIRFVHVQDSDASAGETVVACDSEDLGNNVNWLFGASGAGGAAGPRAFAASLAPNPFRGNVTARVALPADAAWRVRVWDVQGRLVRTLADGAAERGWRSVSWDGRDEAGRAVASGRYFFKIEAGGDVVTRAATRVR